VSFGYDRLSGVQRRVRSVAFVGPLNTGQPAAVAPIATAGGVSTDTAIEVLGFFTDGAVEESRHGPHATDGRPAGLTSITLRSYAATDPHSSLNRILS
jgi:hypothetical protein